MEYAHLKMLPEVTPEVKAWRFGEDM